MPMISDFKENERLSDVQLLVQNVTRGAAASGKEYLNIELRDASGTIFGKKWEVYDEDKEIYVSGNIVEIDADVLLYKDALQLKILGGRKIENDEIDVVKFVKQPPVPKEELIKRFNAHIQSIKDETCTSIIYYMLEKFGDKLFDHPAASSIHHEYQSGLLMHSVSLADIASFLADYYPDVNRDILIAACLLHDMGKVIELEGPVVYKYSLEGKLVGHISIMSSEIQKAAQELNIHNETVTLLQHMILSHHGQHEFGSPVMPLTKEALLLSLIDNLDSKMVCLEKSLETINEGDFTQKIFALDGRSFYKPKK